VGSGPNKCKTHPVLRRVGSLKPLRYPHTGARVQQHVRRSMGRLRIFLGYAAGNTPSNLGQQSLTGTIDCLLPILQGHSVRTGSAWDKSELNLTGIPREPRSPRRL